MQRLLGKAGSANKQAHVDDVAVLREIADQKELIEKREAHLSRKAGAEVALALDFKNKGKKDQALACLKRKKLIDDELAGCLQNRLKLDAQEHALQSLKFSAVTLDVERRATAAIKAKLQQIGGVDAAENQREATEETLEDAYELLGVASQAITIPGQGDEDELWDELEKLEEEEERKKLDAELTTIDLPSEASTSGQTLAFPTAPKTSLEEREERELAELETLAASMRIEAPMPMPMRAASMGYTAPMALSMGTMSMISVA